MMNYTYIVQNSMKFDKIGIECLVFWGMYFLDDVFGILYLAFDICLKILTSLSLCRRVTQKKRTVVKTNSSSPIALMLYDNNNNIEDDDGAKRNGT